MLGMYRFKCSHQCPEHTSLYLGFTICKYFLMQMCIYDARVLTANQNLSENEIGGLTFSVPSLISPLDR